MTREYAAYFKLLLLCGYKDELQCYIDKALAEEDPLPDIVLQLSTAGGNDKEILSVLNEYLRQGEVDYDNAVFDLVMAFLQQKYHSEKMSMKHLSELMYRLAISTDRYTDEPWHTMYYMGDLYEEAVAGYIDREDYQQKFRAFLDNKAYLQDRPPVLPRESFFKRLLKNIRRIFI